MNYMTLPDDNSVQRTDTGSNTKGGVIRQSLVGQVPSVVAPPPFSHSSPNPFSYVNIPPAVLTSGSTPPAPPSSPTLPTRISTNTIVGSASIQHLLGPKLEHIQATATKMEANLKQSSSSSAPPAPSPGSGTSKIDKYARILFPVSFGAFNMVYWVVYLSKDTMETTES
ncbi:UNVERIFIED_CONTAM: hypothetical protein FKN15_027922 [Acipenser sinensis]